MAKKDLRKIIKPVKPYLELTEKEIFQRLTTEVDNITEATLHLFQGGGKRVRAALTIVGAGISGQPMPENVHRIAAAVEIAHGATLVHDDIVDDADLRRGVEAVGKKWGSNVAVLAGDYMFTTALNIAVEEDAPRMFPVLVSATRDMVAGELYQLSYSNVDHINFDRYYHIIELKTARFMGACFQLGGIDANLSDEICGNLYRFGLNIGYAFQIIDDILDVINEKGSLNKNEGKDFFEGKVTLPMLHLFDVVSSEERRKYKSYLKNPDEEKWQEFKKAMVKHDSVAYCHAKALNFVEKARIELDIFPDNEFKDIAFALADFIVDREF